MGSCSGRSIRRRGPRPPCRGGPRRHGGVVDGPKRRRRYRVRLRPAQRGGMCPVCACVGAEYSTAMRDPTCGAAVVHATPRAHTEGAPGPEEDGVSFLPELVRFGLG